MKILEGKHNHNLTTILKSCLFGLIMILPFLAILPSTLYFAFNEHAQNYTHEEVIETYEYETNEVNSVDDLVVGNIYHFELNNYQINANEYFRIVHKGCYNIVYDEDLPIIGTTQNAPILNISNGLFIYTLTDTFISSSYPGFRTSQTYLEIDFKCDFVYQLMDIDQGNFIQYISASDYLGEKNVEVIESEQSPLNAFNTASNTIWNSPIFNWVNNGLGSIAIANMLNVFGIARNTFISNILIYWLSITTIYVIIDIVIGALTLLTHLFNKKSE